MTSLINLDSLSRDAKVNLLDRLQDLDKQIRYNKLDYMFPDNGPFRRELYPLQVKFMNAGADFRERSLFGANQSGKSTCCGTEVAYHATGLYPKWFKGVRFTEGQDFLIICASDTHQKTAEVVQYPLLGNLWDIGSGLIPKANIIMESKRTKSGVANALSEISVNRVDGSVCTIKFLSYIQGREAFQGYTGVKVIWLDEEPHQSDIYSECVTRTIATGGIVMMSFTPLNGITPVVQRFLPHNKFPKNNVAVTEDGLMRWISQITWEDVPHLDEKAKKALAATYMPWEKEARMTGLPALGRGKIFVVPESFFVVEPFQIAPEWKRFYGMDIAFSTGCTCSVHMAWDEENDIIYVYDCYKATDRTPEVHASAIKRRGNWIPGFIDPSSKRTVSVHDKRRFIQMYRELGLNLLPANNAVSTGLLAITNRLVDGTVKVMANCTPLIEEYRTYRFDENGEVALNQDDHAMDAWRYGINENKYKQGMSVKEHDEEIAELERDHNIPFSMYDKDRITGF